MTMTRFIFNLALAQLQEGKLQYASTPVHLKTQCGFHEHQPPSQDNFRRPQNDEELRPTREVLRIHLD
jgi:hypothetical protein